MHQAAPDQGTWDFDDDGSHVCFGKKVLATLKRLRFEPLFFPERFSENIKGHGVACKQVGRQAGVSPIVSVRFHYLPSVARDDQFTLRSFPSHSSNSTTNIERLHVC